MMGTRIHKALGYAGKHPDRDKLGDLLWENATSGEVMALIDAAVKSLADNKVSGYSDLQLNSTWGHKICNMTPPNRFSDVVKYAEHPDDNDGYHIIIPPVWSNTWFRYDDMMDYAACIGMDDMCYTGYKWIETPLYPHLHWMHKDTGEPMDDQYGMRAMDNPDLVPGVPLPVKIIAEHLGFDWKTLRPLLATWWC